MNPTAFTDLSDMESYELIRRHALLNGQDAITLTLDQLDTIVSSMRSRLTDAERAVESAEDALYDAEEFAAQERRRAAQEAAEASSRLDRLHDALCAALPLDTTTIERIFDELTPPA